MHICRKALKFQRHTMHIVSALKMVVAHFYLLCKCCIAQIDAEITVIISCVF